MKLRQGWLAAAAGTALLAGCGQGPGGGGNFQGMPGFYGDNPMTAPTQYKTFSPKIFTVAYIKMVPGNGGNQIFAQHAFFAMPATGEPDVLGVLNRFRSGNWSGGTAPLPLSGIIHKDFQGFSFNQQAKVYVLFDDPNALPPAQRPLYFTQYGANDYGMMNSLDKNKSWYNAKVINIGDPIQAIYAENYFRDPGGKPIPDDPTKGSPTETGGAASQTAKAAAKRPDISDYSINFNYRIQSSQQPGVSVPIAIDPDTGNGYDDPPP